MDRNGTVVVIDDDEQLLEFTSMVLERAGYRVVAGKSGKECLDLVRAYLPDLVLLDVMLPDMDGTAVCRRIKADPITRDTFIILISGVRISAEYRANGLEGGADGYVTKPVSRHELLARVKSMIRIKKSEDMLRTSEARYRRLFETAGEGILILDAWTGEVRDMNPFLQDLLGHRSDDLMGKKLWEIEAFGGRWGRATFSHLQGGKNGEPFRVLLRTAERGQISVEIAGSGYEEGGRPLIQCTLRDVTRRVIAEEALMEAHYTLDRRVKERTAQLVESNRLLYREIEERKETERVLTKSRAQLRYLSNHLQEIFEQERVRLSREIHDELGQILTGIKMDADWVGGYLPVDAPCRERMSRLITHIDGALRAVQSISASLRPPAFEYRTLTQAIRTAAKDFEERTNITCEVDGSGEEPESAICPEVFRIFQECLTNVARHARAGKVVVSLRGENGRYTMTVEDDGRGITRREMEDPRSIGLTGMNERADSIGGTLTITGANGEGTAVTLDVPLKRARRKGARPRCRTGQKSL